MKMITENDIVVRQATTSDAYDIQQLARQHVLNDYDPNKRCFSENGFLFANLSIEEYQNLIRSEPAVFVACRLNNVVGYILATEAKSNKYENLPEAKIIWTNGDIKKIYELNNYLYLWMIAVHKNYQNCGVGKKLISKLKLKTKTNGLKIILGDFMEEPILNLKSKQFFLSQKFISCGALTIADYFGSGYSKWRVFSYEV